MCWWPRSQPFGGRELSDAGPCMHAWLSLSLSFFFVCVCVCVGLLVLLCVGCLRCNMFECGACVLEAVFEQPCCNSPFAANVYSLQLRHGNAMQRQCNQWRTAHGPDRAEKRGLSGRACLK
eukprot:UN1345